jgi:acyl carrier protein
MTVLEKVRDYCANPFINAQTPLENLGLDSLGLLDLALQLDITPQHLAASYRVGDLIGYDEIPNH